MLLRSEQAAPAFHKRGRIARQGENCWRIEKSSRSAFLIDGEAYFDALVQTLPLAERRIWILGWDFNPWIKLSPRQADAPTLGCFLRQLVEQRPALEIRVLIWAYGPLYSGRSLKVFREREWADHPRISLVFDHRHPLRASHHQKLVCVDDRTAFVGGIDLTAGRWDSSDHPVPWRWRRKPSGEAYSPVHDVQAMVCGAAARALSEIAAARWRRATGESLAPLDSPSRPPWPTNLAPDLLDCPVAIARTQPPRLGIRMRREAAKLTDAALAAAKHSLYIETQYFASFRVARQLRASLQRPDGPEILIILTKSSRGLLEQFVMAHNRNRVIRRLKRADRHHRLRVLYATTEAGDGKRAEILIHSKVIVVDDVLARVGSSNLNNRSEGFDSECDIAFEAQTPRQRRAIAGLRNRLLAEHLGSDAGSVASEIAQTGSMLAALDRLNTQKRRLEPVPIGSMGGELDPLPATALLDPRRPWQPLLRLRRWLRALKGMLFGHKS
ncbi:phospholipase D-like domain-containing protein [Nitratireductor sp. ZSWI3]|uniref:phospholipase D-like domain-containing protein n=1 Tax=Nitratireductor sp. ZSWI3 TaxID=2966359 RepID=UPI00214FC79C|nr:phospholipase D-like domain-containing protein [Nitratireductor sp. ZSWI3]MCR4264704.1 phospholipase D-like domain-containing protein [Nitratireductor sp. ZSWI3]